MSKTPSGLNRCELLNIGVEADLVDALLRLQTRNDRAIATLVKLARDHMLDSERIEKLVRGSTRCVMGKIDR